MILSLPRIHKNVWYAAFIAAAILFGGLFLLHHISPLKRDVVATGLLGDMVFTFPLVYYFLVIRPLQLRKWSIMLVISICCGVAYLTLPTHQKQYVIQLRHLTVFVELGVIIYSISKIRKLRAEYKRLQQIFPDTAYNFKQSMINVLGNTVPVKMLATELLLMKFGLFFLVKSKPGDQTCSTYTVHKESSYPAFFGVIMFVGVVEMVSMHLLLSHYTKTGAIVLTVLSVYSTIFIIADLAAIVKSPILVLDDKLLLRAGLRWRTVININNIATIERIKDSYEGDSDCFKGGVMKTDVNVLITLKHPVSIDRIYRKPIKANSIVLGIDKPDDFIGEIKG